MENTDAPRTYDIYRILNLFERLNKGEVLSKESLSQQYNVNEKTVERDIKKLRNYLQEYYQKDDSLPYDRQKNGYVLQEKVWGYQTNQQILAAAKILLESRAFSREEISILIENLVFSATPEQRQKIREMLRNELYHYQEPQHRRPLFELIWQLSDAIFRQRVIDFQYTRQDGTKQPHTALPLAIMFSEYYFYLIVIYLKEDLDKGKMVPLNPKQKYPVILRLDRLENISVTGKKYIHPYSQRFEAGELRKRIQFMYGGEMMSVTFRFWGSSIEAVRDRLPLATVSKQPDGKYLVQAEVFGDGIKMWLFSQLDKIEVLKPLELREEMKQIAERIAEIYKA